jgi:hypothetical protein
MFKKSFSVAVVALLYWNLAAATPAIPVMTLYKFNGDLEIPYYDIRTFQRRGPGSPAGTLAQGTSLIPCLVIRNGHPLTGADGTPYVGFKVVVDSRRATPASTQVFKDALAARRAKEVPNHHCGSDAHYVLDARHLYALTKAPFFDLSRSGRKDSAHGQSQLDSIVRAFHNSSYCASVDRSLIGRRGALGSAWSRFIAHNAERWPRSALEHARQLDYTMRTAIFEGHLGRGCNAYGTCERNIIALTIRNRGLDGCRRGQGCRRAGDFEGVASKVSQYNIWDEYLTQTSGLTSCFLRDDLASTDYYDKIRGIYQHNRANFERILFGTDRDLADIFPGVPLGQLKAVRHYYHAPAMGKCFPNNDRVEYISGAVAQKGGNFALIANQRVQVGRKVDGGYLFKEFLVRAEGNRDVTSVVDNYPGFVIDGRKITLRPATNCRPYGVPRGCRFRHVRRYRKTPSWIDAGRPMAIHCRIADGGEKCRTKARTTTVTVGGTCDTQMRPVAGVR